MFSELDPGRVRLGSLWSGQLPKTIGITFLLFRLDRLRGGRFWESVETRWLHDRPPRDRAPKPILTLLKTRRFGQCLPSQWPLGTGAQWRLQFESWRLNPMYLDRKVVVIMPAYNAGRTLKLTYDEVRAQGVADLIILVDDKSCDDTVARARQLEGVQVHAHEVNRGYGANQKTCYRLALEAGADIVVMIHPDYQYTPRLLPAMVSMIGNGLHPCVLGSRILGGYALKGGMPLWRYVANRFLTLVENLLLGAKLSEYHTGYRAFSREILQTLRLDDNSDDFVFDNQMLAQILWHGFTIGEVSCPTKYFAEASSVSFPRSVKYGLACLATGLSFRLARMGLMNSKLFPKREGARPV